MTKELWLAADYTAPDNLVCAIEKTREEALKALRTELEKRGRTYQASDVFTRLLREGDLFVVGDSN